MGLFSNLERRLSEGVNGAFAKAFRADVQPVEIAAEMRGAMDDRAASTKKGERPVVPNLFTVDLSRCDYERLDPARDEISDELIASATEHADVQRYLPGGPIAVEFAEDPDLETGVFRLRPSIAKQVETARRPARRQPREYDEFNPNSARQEQPQQYQPQQYQPQQYQPNRVQPPQPYDDRPSEPGRAPGRASRQPSPAPREPSPAAPRRFKQRPSLIIDGDRYPLLGAITVIGRDDEADIMLDDPGISRRHSEIRVTNDGPHLVMTVRDLGSTNGTFLNGDAVDRAHLHDGDRITVGRTHLLFEEGGRK